MSNKSKRPPRRLSATDLGNRFLLLFVWAWVSVCHPTVGGDHRRQEGDPERLRVHAHGPDQRADDRRAAAGRVRPGHRLDPPGPGIENR